MGEIAKDILIAVIAALPGTVLALIALKKSPAEKTRTEAERHKLYADIADRWAEHVDELQRKLLELEEQGDCDRHEITGLRLDIQQVRRENEQYRSELIERDAIISDLKHWAEALVKQLRQLAPHVEPVAFRRSTSG